MKPLIGIPGSLLTAHVKEFEGMSVTYTQQGLIDGLLEANGLPVLLPITTKNDQDIVDYVTHVDGILLAGGHDIAPHFYNEEPHRKLQDTLPIRDEFEMAIIKEAWNQNKPILGICRGFQLLNILFGGTLYQDLSDFDSFVQHLQSSKEYVGIHSVDFSPGSWLSGIFGEEYRVNSYHHQGIKKVGEGFREVAWSKDGLVEGIEHTDPTRKVAGVQWHPEWMRTKDPIMQSLFDAFVALVENEKETSV